MVAAFALFKATGSVGLFFLWYWAWTNNWLAGPTFFALIFTLVLLAAGTVWAWAAAGIGIERLNDRLLVQADVDDSHQADRSDC